MSGLSYRPFRCDPWLHVESKSPGAQGGRGLSLAAVHDAGGERVASLSHGR